LGPQLLNSSSRIGILWGGGLGDLLILRILLQAIGGSVHQPPILMTTAHHLPRLFGELCNGMRVEVISREPKKLSTFVKTRRNHFDFLYLGPYPTLRTLILGRLLAPAILWQKRHRARHVFLGEQVLADLSALGLCPPQADEMLPNILPWDIQRGCSPFGNDVPFLALHPGAKQRWQTSRWPVENWQLLIRKALEETEYSLCLIGVESESEMLASLREPLPRPLRNRVSVALSWPMKDVAELIAASAGVVCHNSGILHLATFLKKRTISITGSSALFWRPPYPWVMNLTSGQCDLACNCYRCPVPFFRARCIMGLKTEKVWEAITGYLLKAAT
jgi:hypothetical protein